MEDQFSASLRKVVDRVTEETGRARTAVTISYREDPEGGEFSPWIVGIACRFAGSRTRGHYTCEGYGASPDKAATDALDGLRRAVDDGRIKPAD